MPSRKTSKYKRKLMMFPLMDMFFILLMFFLVVPEGMMSIKNIEAPKKENIFGEANILIQIESNGNKYIWLDSHAIRLYNVVRKGRSQLTSSQKKEYFERLRINDFDELRQRIEGLSDSLEKNSLPIHRIVVRCPNTLSYSCVRDVLNITKTHKINWTIIGGSKESLDFRVTAIKGRESLKISFL